MATSKEQYGKLLALLEKNAKGIGELQNSMVEMRALRTHINLWKPQMDGRVNNLESAVLELSKKVEKVLSGLPQAVPLPTPEVTIASSSAVSEGEPPLPKLQAPGSTHLEPTPSRAASGSLDQSKAAYGVVFTTAPGQHRP
jgi:hypothetical protein